MNDSTDNSSSVRALLYLSGEMPPAERRAFELELSRDAGLQRELETLREAEAAFNQGLSSLDAAEPIDARVRSAERQWSRSLAQWQVNRLSETTEPAVIRLKRFPLWLYPLSAAAVVLIALGGWYLSFDRNADGTLAGPPERDIPTIPMIEIPDDETPTPDLELAITDGDSFGELEEEMSKLLALSRAMQ